AYRVESGEKPELCGTPAYMAPEMAAGGAIDERTDVYLLGATLHEILTGHLKHPGTNVSEILEGIARHETYDYGADVSPALASIARRATAVDPSGRFATAAEMRQ